MLIVFLNENAIAENYKEVEHPIKIDFVNVAIAPKVWKEVLNEQFIFASIYENPLKKVFPYIEVFKNYRTDLLIKKWNSKVKIQKTNDPIMNDQINKVIKELEVIENLEVSLVENDPNVIIRVYPSFQEYCKSKLCKEGVWGYKNGGYQDLYYHPKSSNENLSEFDIKENLNVQEKSGFIYYKDATRFTRDHEYQVSGFFVTDESYAIYRSECNLYKDNPEKTKRILITECILRSLGLPNLSRNKNSILRIRKNKDDFQEIPNISDYDKKLISYLYNSKMKKGFFKKSALDVLDDLIK